MLDYLRENVNNLCIVDGDDICEKLGSPKVLNIALLGAAVRSDALGFTVDEIENVIKKRLPERFHEINIKALKGITE